MNPLFGLPDPLYRVHAGLLQPQGEGLGGLRPDGRKKGLGWFGLLPRSDGSYSTELSAGVKIGGKETLIPLLAPNLTEAEVRWLLEQPEDDPEFFNKLPKGILQKAIKHAEGRGLLGLSPFADE